MLTEKEMAHAKFRKNHEKLKRVIQENPGSRRSQLSSIKSSIKNRKKLNNHLNVFFAKSQIIEDGYRRITWREQYDRIQVFEDLIKKMVKELENDPETQGLVNAYLVHHALIFVPKIIEDKLEYVLFRAPIEMMNTNAQAIWNYYQSRREELDNKTR